MDAGSHDLTVRIWEARSGTCQATMHGHTAIVYSVAASPDGLLLASGAEDNTARVWSVEGACLQVLEVRLCVLARVRNRITATLPALPARSHPYRCLRVPCHSTRPVSGRLPLLPRGTWSPPVAMAGPTSGPGMQLPRTRRRLRLSTSRSSLCHVPWGRWGCGSDETRSLGRSWCRRVQEKKAEVARAQQGSSGGGALPDGLKIEDASALQRPGQRGACPCGCLAVGCPCARGCFSLFSSGFGGVVPCLTVGHRENGRQPSVCRRSDADCTGGRSGSRVQLGCPGLAVGKDWRSSRRRRWRRR